VDEVTRPVQHTNPKPHIVVLDFPFAVEKSDLDRVARTLAGYREIDVASTHHTPMRRMTQVQIYLVDPRWSVEDRNAFGDDIIASLQLINRHPWVTYREAAALVNAARQVEFVKAALPGNAVVLDLSDKFHIAKESRTEEALSAATTAITTLVKSDVGQNVAGNIIAAGVGAATTVAWSQVMVWVRMFFP